MDAPQLNDMNDDLREFKTELVNGCTECQAEVELIGTSYKQFIVNHAERCSKAQP